MRSFYAGAMAWSDSLAEELCICNVWGVLRLNHSAAWSSLIAFKMGSPLPGPFAAGGQTSPFDLDVEADACTWGHPELLALKLSFTLHSAASSVFKLLTDVSRRAEWDPLFRAGREVAATLPPHRVTATHPPRATPPHCHRATPPRRVGRTHAAADRARLPSPSQRGR